MKILLDENIPRRLKFDFSTDDHIIRSFLCGLCVESLRTLRLKKYSDNGFSQIFADETLIFAERNTPARQLANSPAC